MVSPKYLCDSHLLTEHRDCHRILGALRAGRKLDGYVGKLEPRNLVSRHDEVVAELQRRSLEPAPHNSPLIYYTESEWGAVSHLESIADLQQCAECAWHYKTWSDNV